MIKASGSRTQVKLKTLMTIDSPKGDNPATKATPWAAFTGVFYTSLRDGSGTRSFARTAIGVAPRTVRNARYVLGSAAGPLNRLHQLVPQARKPGSGRDRTGLPAPTGSSTRVSDRQPTPTGSVPTD